MENQVDNKFSWVIENFNCLEPVEICSDEFSIGGCKWQLVVYPQGYGQMEYLSLFLEVYNHGSLPRGWKRHANFSFTVVNQISDKLSKLEKTPTQIWFDEKFIACGFAELLPLNKLHEDYSGFLVNGELKILAQVDVLQVIGESNESEEASQPLKKVLDQKTVGVLSSGLLNKTQQFQEGFEVYGFLLLPSQVESVKRIFESHPDIATEVRTKNQHLRKTYINVLLGLIETLCQSPEELTDDDLKEASSFTLSCLVNAGFKVDWLEKKVHQVLEKKKTVKKSEARLLELNEELLNLNKKIQDLNALLEKETSNSAAAKTPLSFNDFL